MTLLSMWLNEQSVALATDCKMTGYEEPVHKLNCLPSGKVMIGIGYGDGAGAWLKCCPCTKHPNDYPGHWVQCSKAENIEALEQFIRDNLQDGEFPSDGTLRLCVAGFNRQGSLEAFVLDGTGQRYKELAQGEVWFNCASKLATGHPGRPRTRWRPEPRFWTLKEVLETQGVEFPGVETLRAVCKQLVDFCSGREHTGIGLALDFCCGNLASEILSSVERFEC